MLLRWIPLLLVVTADVASSTETNKNALTLKSRIPNNDESSWTPSSLAASIVKGIGNLAADFGASQNTPMYESSEAGDWLLPKYFRSMLDKKSEIFRPKQKGNEVVIYCGQNKWPNPAAITRQMAKNATEQFCRKEMTLDPDFKLDDHKFYAKTPTGMAYSNVVKYNVVIRIQATFAIGHDQEGCAPPSKFQMRKDNCVKTLLAIIDDCDTATVKEKNGGYLIEKSDYGCVKWEIFAQIIN